MLYLAEQETRGQEGECVRAEAQPSHGPPFLCAGGPGGEPGMGADPLHVVRDVGVCCESPSDRGSGVRAEEPSHPW